MIYLSCGCLWTMQHYLNQLVEVKGSVAGFMSPNINLEEVKKTLAIETVKVDYNNLITLLDSYFNYVKVSKKSNKANYSNTVYYTNNEQKIVIEKYFKNKNLDIKIEKARYFTKSLEYHQNYLQKKGLIE